ncbi:MAG: YbaN family protein [Bacteriovoracaceae bacterium]
MKWLWFTIAWISFALGIIGAFLPIIPTTPFLILSAFLFSKSSPRFHRWLLSLPVAGDGIRDWQENRVIRTKAKILCVVMITGSLIYINFFLKVHIALKVFISLILVPVAIFVSTRKSR